MYYQVTLSGYSSIYFEQMLKMSGERLTIWERNFQLAFYSSVLLSGMMVYTAIMEPESRGYQPTNIHTQCTINTVMIWTCQNILYFIHTCKLIPNKTSTLFLHVHMCVYCAVFLKGWTINTWLIAFIAAAGGLLGDH